MKAVVTGMIATYPLGGVLYDYAQYALALERLGFDVYYLEDTGLPTYDPGLGRYGEDPSYGVSFLEQSLKDLSPTLGNRWYFKSSQGNNFGLDPNLLVNIVQKADLFLNVSGATLIRNEYLLSPRKVLIDTDPGWNHFVNYPRWDRGQGWQDTHGFRAHDYFFTYAQNIDQKNCVLPTLGLDWITTVPPVLTDLWEPEPPGERWTTVLTWRNFPQTIASEHGSYGTKEVEFPVIETLPSILPQLQFEIAVGGGTAPVDKWRGMGWSVIDSVKRSLNPTLYKEYIQSSRGEFSVAKNIYVATQSGWFSCRSVCYLASGRPVVLQDTGFSNFLPTGDGLYAFRSLEEAIEAVVSVESNYTSNCRAARQIAETQFSAEKVICKMLERIGL